MYEIIFACQLKLFLSFGSLTEIHFKTQCFTMQTLSQLKHPVGMLLLKANLKM